MSRYGFLGQDIELRARFKDDLGDTFQASGVSITIFDTTATDLTDYSQAVLVSGTPTYLENGIFSYTYSIPGSLAEGTWYDIWEGFVNHQSLSETLQFDVSAGGEIETIGNQLYANNIVQVTLSSGILATDGTALNEEYEFEFMTTTTPVYTNTRKVKLAIGGLIRNLEDDTIQQVILESSVEADTLNFQTSITNSNVYQHARREYVTCLTALTLLDNIGSSTIRAKTLDNLHVEYDTSGFMNTINRLKECLDRWLPQLISGGGSKAKGSPQRFVKGLYDPDRPYVGRSWDGINPNDQESKVPAANAYQKSTNQYRWKKTFKKRYW